MNQTRPEVCDIQGCEHPVHARRLCSMHYQRAKRSGEAGEAASRKGETFSRTCPCGASITVQPSRAASTRYCSKECLVRYRAKPTGRPRGADIPATCPTCGESFVNRPGRERLYCSPPCDEHRTRHGLHTDVVYRTWLGMVARCTNPRHQAYSNYGGRGISVAPQWIDDPGPFVDWIYTNLGPRPKGMSLDRIDNDGNYEPGNLRWATAAQQVANRRPQKEAF